MSSVIDFLRYLSSAIHNIATSVTNYDQQVGLHYPLLAYTARIDHSEN